MKKKGLTQVQLADALQVSQGAASKWLRGSMPAGDRLLAIARYFDVPSEYLLGRDGPPSAEGGPPDPAFLSRLAKTMIAGYVNQRQLAAYVHVPEAEVDSWLLQKSIPSVTTAAKVAECLGVNVEWLLYGKGDRLNNGSKRARRLLPRTGLRSDTWRAEWEASQKFANLPYPDSLRAAMNAKGMTEADLAEAAGCSVKTMAVYLSGQRYPRPEECANLSEKLGLSIEKLLGLSSPPPGQLPLAQVLNSTEEMLTDEEIESLNVLENNQDAAEFAKGVLDKLDASNRMFAKLIEESSSFEDLREKMRAYEHRHLRGKLFSRSWVPPGVDPADPATYG